MRSQCPLGRLVLMLVMALMPFAAAGCAQVPSTISGSAAQAEELRGNRPRQTPNVTPDERAALAGGNTAFALDLYRTLRSGDGNLFFSPYSISAALAMAHGGARSAMAEQMAQALHFTLPPTRLHPAFNALDQELAGRGKPQAESDPLEQAFVLKVANTMWGQSDYKFQPAFLDLLAEHYGAGMHLADFKRAPEPARGACRSADQAHHRPAVHLSDPRQRDRNSAFYRANPQSSTLNNGSWSRRFRITSRG